MDAIGWGQAAFDEPYGPLSPADRVLLYAYWNQLGHLEELSEAFQQLFGDGRPTEPFIVVDLGCGPFTGGLALAGQIDEFDYIGVDKSEAMRALGEQLATATESMSSVRIGRQWVTDLEDVRWERALGWRPVIVIVSFLLASRSLRAEQLIEQLDQFLARLTQGPVTILYTNSPKAGPNRSYPRFRDALLGAGFALKVDDTGPVSTERRRREIRYALFHRPPQRTLPLGDI